MKINPAALTFLEPTRLTGADKTGIQTEGKSFLQFLNESLGEVNRLENRADSMSVAFAAGDPNVDIHNLMLAMEEANIALQLTIEVRNKMIEAYQEIMRMQL